MSLCFGIKMQKLNILIVEDEFLIAKSMCKKFETFGHSASSIPSGIEAIKLINLHKFDLVICDLMLQDISGFDVIDEIISKPTTPKIVIMTAYSSAQIMERAKNYDCKIFQKPFSDLEAALLEMIN